MPVLRVRLPNLEQVLVVLVAVWTLANAVNVVDAALTVGVLAHEVNCWQV